MKIVSIGEVLWDVIGSEEHLGGAPFNFSAHARKLSHEVLFVSAVGADERGDRILDRMTGLGLSTRYVTRVPDQPTGSVTVTLDPAGQPSYVIHRPAAYDFPRLSQAELESVFSPAPDWIYFGTLQQMSSVAKQLTLQLLDRSRSVPRMYDVNLRDRSYQPAQVRELMSRATLLKLNEQEVLRIEAMFDRGSASLEDFCRNYADEFGFESVCVTRGAAGCALLMNGEYLEAPGYPVKISDAVGAGDAFAAALLHGIGCGWLPARTADFANRVGALVAG
ncbi:MAG: carbohydrate kinase family protein, partial [Candidatus Acidiferrales bacterium]